ncbi:MAG: hydantoinase/oxoprolinase family protein, partial [Pseudorhodobacter sp.]|nr:hydantoinase/oxoprolinase family protein [Pseudorhodobacter sp.]
IGRRTGLDGFAAAGAVLRLANIKMAGAIRMVSILRGYDPRDFTLFAFGGAGPLHATALARELGLPRVLVPARPGITNALGCVVADLRHDFVRTLNRPLDLADMDQVHSILAIQADEGRRLIAAESITLTSVECEYSADMQFIGQTHLLRIPLPDATPTRKSLQTLFEAAYFSRFRVELPSIRANLVNLNTSVIGRRPELDLSQLIASKDRLNTPTPREICLVWFTDWVDTPVYWRDELPLNLSLQGPAIIEQMDTTTLVEPGCHVTSDTDGNLVIEVSNA